MSNDYLPEQKHVDEDQCAALATFVRALDRLDTLTWAAAIQIPIAVLDAIHLHSHATLAVTRFTRPDPAGDHTDPAELALAASPALTSIHAASIILEPMDMRKSSVLRIIMQAPNLRNVSFASKILRSWPGWETFRRKDAELEFLRDLQPSTSVRSLELIGNQFINRRWRSDGPIRLENLERFVYVGPKAYGHTLELMRELRWITERTTGLKELSMSLHRVISQDEDEPPELKRVVSSCLTTLSPLVSLRLDDWMNAVDLNVVLAHHGDTLRKLALHMVQVPPESRPEKMTMSLDDLLLIKELCPHLTELGMDLQRVSLDPKISDHEDVFDFIAPMRLERIHFRLDWDINSMSDGDWNRYMAYYTEITPVNPEVLESFVLDAWMQIFGHADVANMRTVRELEVTSGMLSYDDYYHERKNEIIGKDKGKPRWVARSHERDDRPGECMLVVAPTWKKEEEIEEEQISDERNKEESELPKREGFMRRLIRKLCVV